MKKARTESLLPAQLDKNPIPLVSEETIDHSESFLFAAREAIGYSLENIHFEKDTLVSSKDPVFDAIFIDYTKLAYIEYLSNIYRFRMARNHREEAQAIFNAYQELVQSKQAYVYLRMFAAGDAPMLMSLFSYLNTLATQNHAVQSIKQLKYADAFPKLGKNISESRILIASFIFS
ncbi:MAG: hypothetical protein QG639_516 [Patescibacteria group bacterium]|nr:hypothetical protein [Patescibacteria group bacterium]